MRKLARLFMQSSDCGSYCQRVFAAAIQSAREGLADPCRKDLELPPGGNSEKYVSTSPGRTLERQRCANLSGTFPHARQAPVTGDTASVDDGLWNALAVVAEAKHGLSLQKRNAHFDISGVGMLDRIQKRFPISMWKTSAVSSGASVLIGPTC